MTEAPIPVLQRFRPELLARIDAARGDIPRTTWITRACEAALEPASEPALADDAPQDEPRPKKGVTRRVNIDPKTIKDRTPLAIVPGARLPIGYRHPKFGRDGKSGAALLEGHNVLDRYDGDKPVWRFEVRK